MGCSGSRPTPEGPTKEPSRDTGLRKMNQLVYRGSLFFAQYTSRRSVKSSTGETKPRGRRRRADKLLKARVIEGHDHPAEYGVSHSPQDGRGRTTSIRSRNSSKPRSQSIDTTIKSRPTLGRFPSGYRKSGQHGRSASQVRREQQDIEDSKPYKYTGPPLKGKRRPGQIPSTALPVRKASPSPHTKPYMRLKGKRRRVPGPMGMVVHGQRHEEDATGGHSHHHHHHHKPSQIVRGLRQAGTSAASQDITRVPSYYSGFEGTRRGLIRSREKGKKVGPYWNGFMGEQFGQQSGNSASDGNGGHAG